MPGATSLKYRFLQFTNRHRLIQPQQAILIAVSGGVDSVVLLHLLVTWQQFFRSRLGVAHFNHQLRGSSADEDEAFVAELSREFQLPFYAGRGDVRNLAHRQRRSLEEAARMAREAFLVETCEQNGFDHIATGHNLNDQAETMLMRLLQGAGVSGLAGIRLRRGRFIRPLLFAEREAIVEYAAHHQLTYREDPTNRDLRFVRNRIRHRLLPLLRETFHLSRLDSFLRTGLILQEWLEMLEEEVQQALSAVKILPGQNKIALDIPAYCQYFSQIQVKVLEFIIAQLTGERQTLTFRRFESFSRWLEKGGRGKILVHPGIQAWREGEQILFQLSAEENLPEKVDVWLNPGDAYRNETLQIEVSIGFAPREAIDFRLSPHTEFLDADQLRFPLRLRTWQPGDKLQPLGANYLKKVSDLLTDCRSLPLPKQSMLVLESAGEIVWVVGCRIGENYKITPQTKRVLKLEMNKLESMEL
ncbi:MAG: tRNA lysidine(34) synthetase TilS [Calditrichaeota bacterium]|nr:MAG: tRNA lysidine(34) synthetase TilS [Calditrichota bacterium]